MYLNANQKVGTSRAMVQLVSRWPLTSEAQFQSQVNLFEICVWGSGTRTSSSPSPSVAPVNVFPLILHIHTLPSLFNLGERQCR